MNGLFTFIKIEINKTAHANSSRCLSDLLPHVPFFLVYKFEIMCLNFGNFKSPIGLYVTTPFSSAAGTFFLVNCVYKPIIHISLV